MPYLFAFDVAPGDGVGNPPAGPVGVGNPLAGPVGVGSSVPGDVPTPVIAVACALTCRQPSFIFEYTCVTR